MGFLWNWDAIGCDFRVEWWVNLDTAWQTFGLKACRDAAETGGHATVKRNSINPIPIRQEQIIPSITQPTLRRNTACVWRSAQPTAFFWFVESYSKLNHVESPLIVGNFLEIPRQISKISWPWGQDRAGETGRPGLWRRETCGRGMKIQVCWHQGAWNFEPLQ